MRLLLFEYSKIFERHVLDEDLYFYLFVRSLIFIYLHIRGREHLNRKRLHLSQTTTYKN